MDLIVKNVRLADRSGCEPFDIGVAEGRIAATGHGLGEAGESYDASGQLACAGLIETRSISIDRACWTASRSSPAAISTRCGGLARSRKS
jgi:N-acyl-D-aspartate/D-glutamate deacylase